MIMEEYLDHFVGLDHTDFRSYIIVTHRLGGSDLHFEPLISALRVRARVEGRLLELARLPVQAGNRKSHPLCQQLRAQSGMNLQSRQPEDGRIEVEVDQKTVNLRISTMPVLLGEKIVCRLFDVDRIQNLSGLDFRAENAGKVQKIVQRRSGLVLVAGPSGSGKTTTLYALLKTMESSQSHVVTVEEPVEYLFEGVTQVQVSEAGVDFASALRGILRQDPDIIMIGEIRDRQTAEIASQAAMTGHLVLSTVHSKDSISAIMRLMELGVAPIVIAQALDGIIAQRILPRLCLNCKTALRQEPLETLFTHAAVGCDTCRGDGHLGRCGIQEVLLVDDHFRRLIASELDEEELRMVALKNGLETLKEDAVFKSVSGSIALRDALGATDEGLARIVANASYYSGL